MLPGFNASLVGHHTLFTLVSPFLAVVLSASALLMNFFRTVILEGGEGRREASPLNPSTQFHVILPYFMRTSPEQMQTALRPFQPMLHQVRGSLVHNTEVMEGEGNEDTLEVAWTLNTERFV